MGQGDLGPALGGAWDQRWWGGGLGPVLGQGHVGQPLGERSLGTSAEL